MRTTLPPLMERYEELELIARGGMAEVWRGCDTKLRRTVAIKLLDERYSEERGFRARLQREARTAASLGSHPHVVLIYDVGEWDERPFIVMQYASGGSIAGQMQEGRQPVGRCLRWLDQAADALDHAHYQGIVHRDVKPGNLLLDGQGGVLVADFGIARAADAALTQLTRTGDVLGTPGYIAPEQAEDGDVTVASDRYSLAAVGFELLTGRRPFERSTTIAEVIAHVHDEVPSVIDLDATLPAGLDRVFARALAKDPDARYASATQFVEALRGELEVSPEPGSDVAAIERFDSDSTAVLPVAGGPREGAAAVAAGETRPPESVVRARPARRSNRLSLLAPLALLALAAVLAAALIASRGDQPSAARDSAPARMNTPRTRTSGPAPATRRTAVPVDAPQASPNDPVEPLPVIDATAVPSQSDARRLNDEAYALMRRGRYADAVPILERALPALQGLGISEAYTSYNLAKSLLETGQCDRVQGLLERSQQLQRPRREITDAMAEFQSRCG